MAKDVEIKWNDEAIKKIQEAIASNASVKIGILSNEPLHSEDSLGAVDLGAIHEFGSISRNIQERSFIRLTESQRKDDYEAWVLKNKNKIFEAVVKDGLSSILPKIGALWVGYVKKTFRTSGYGKWKKLSKKTKMNRTKGKRKGPIKPLIDTGALMNSITYEVSE